MQPITIAFAVLAVAFVSADGSGGNPDKLEESEILLPFVQMKYSETNIERGDVILRDSIKNRAILPYFSFTHRREKFDAKVRSRIKLPVRYCVGIEFTYPIDLIRQVTYLRPENETVVSQIQIYNNGTCQFRKPIEPKRTLVELAAERYQNTDGCYVRSLNANTVSNMRDRTPSESTYEKEVAFDADVTQTFHAFYNPRPLVATAHCVGILFGFRVQPNEDFVPSFKVVPPRQDLKDVRLIDGGKCHLTGNPFEPDQVGPSTTPGTDRFPLNERSEILLPYVFKKYAEVSMMKQSTFSQIKNRAKLPKPSPDMERETFDARVKSFYKFPDMFCAGIEFQYPSKLIKDVKYNGSNETAITSEISIVNTGSCTVFRKGEVESGRVAHTEIP